MALGLSTIGGRRSLRTSRQHPQALQAAGQLKQRRRRMVWQQGCRDWALRGHGACCRRFRRWWSGSSHP